MPRVCRAWPLAAGLALTASLILYAGPAQAECTNPLINTCINSDTYWPTPGPTRFANVVSAETVAASQVAFGLMATYLSRPVVLRVASPGPGGSDQYVVDDQVTGNFLFAYGVTNRLQLDFALPVTFVQSGAGTSPITGGAALRDTSIRDVRFGFAYAVVPRARISTDAAAAAKKHTWALATRLTVVAPTGDSTDFAGERSAVFAPNVAADYRYSILFAGVDVGARVRPITEFAGARVGTQLTTGLGAGVDIFGRDLLSVMAEARAYVNFAEQHETSQSVFGVSSRPNDKTITPAEWMLTARSAPLLAGDIAFFAGGGGPIPIGDPAITVPRYRFLLGALYAPTARDTDGDGIIDKNDFCPTRAGVRGAGERPGCPAEEPAENKQ